MFSLMVSTANVHTVNVNWVEPAPARATGCIGLAVPANTSIAATVTTRRIIDSHPCTLICLPERHAIWTASVTYEPATRAPAPFTPSRRADGKMKPEAREIARQAATSVCAAFGFSTRMRLVGPEMLIAPTGRPSAPKMGAAMQLASGSVSPLSSAIPHLQVQDFSVAKDSVVYGFSILRQNALHVGERRLHETAVARRPADERHELGTQMVAPIVSDPLHVPAVLQRAEQTKSRTFH